MALSLPLPLPSSLLKVPIENETARYFVQRSGRPVSVNRDLKGVQTFVAR